MSIKQNSPTSVVYKQYQDGWNANENQMKNTPSLFWGYFLKKKEDTATRSFISCCFILTFTLADIIFNWFLKLYSTLSKKVFSSQFFFFNRFTQPHPPSQNLLSVTKVFCWQNDTPLYIYIANLIMNQESSSHTVHVCVHCILLVHWWLWNLS